MSKIGFRCGLCVLPLLLPGCPASDKSANGTHEVQVDQEAELPLPDRPDPDLNEEGEPADPTPEPPDPVPDEDTSDETSPDAPDDSSSREPAVWNFAFVASSAGALSAVWGSAPDDVFVVGGTPEQGEIYHYDGLTWRAMQVPPVPLLVWVYGFGWDDVYAVGVGGGALHYNGQAWTSLTSGTTEDLWGVWGPAPDDLWIVGGTVGMGEPELLHYDGVEFRSIPVPTNDRNATSLFKVWGIGSKIFAVGERGLIIQYENDEWFQVPAGANADDDFVALWGTAEDNIVAVGGRAIARIAVYDGANWTTMKPAGIPGLSAVCMFEHDEAVVGGVSGYVGSYNPVTDTLTTQVADTNLSLHGAWADEAGRYYAVGGRFAEPYVGVAFVRTFGDPGFTAQPPLDMPPECVADTDCSTGRVCDGGECLYPVGCAGSDNDADGWLNSCDNCVDVFNPAQADGDFDGVGDSCDACPGFDDSIDTDGDSVADGCDACLGFNDLQDSDGDGAPDGCDVCSGSDDSIDTDSDSVPDACDVCPGSDDKSDADDDGVPDGCDSCPGYDDADDADTDGTPDGCDTCHNGDDSLDSDNDGVPDGCDLCPGFDDNADSDADGVPNGCDTCDGDNLQDTDADGVPDACDICPGSDDRVDADNDAIPDDCDRCPGFNDMDDVDGDGVPDGCDICSGFDDDKDDDGDGVPSGCDTCPGFDDNEDSDDDSVPDGCDGCPGFDDGTDTDADSVPDGCDICPGFDDSIDTDGDSVPDGCDVCPGSDDSIDSDGNGIPDGCCAAEPDCLLGEACVAGICEAVVIDIELGRGDPYVKIPEGGDMPVFPGFQGFGDLFVSYRTLGYTRNGNATVTLQITMADDGSTVVPGNPALGNPFTEIAPGINEQRNDHWFLVTNPFPLFGRRANVLLTITDESNPLTSTTIHQTVIIVNANDP